MILQTILIFFKPAKLKFIIKTEQHRATVETILEAIVCPIPCHAVSLYKKYNTSPLIRRNWPGNESSGFSLLFDFPKLR